MTDDERVREIEHADVLYFSLNSDGSMCMHVEVDGVEREMPVQIVSVEQWLT